MDVVQVRLVSVMDAQPIAGFRMQVEVKTGVDLRGEDVYLPLPTSSFDETGYSVRVMTGRGRQPVALVPIALGEFKELSIGRDLHMTRELAEEILGDLIQEISGPVGLVRNEAPEGTEIRRWSDEIRNAMAKARARMAGELPPDDVEEALERR
jgi:hypothetical protein